MTFFASKKRESISSLDQNDLVHGQKAISNIRNNWLQTISQKIREKFTKNDVNNKLNYTNSYETMCFDNYAYGDGKSYGLSRLS